MKFGTRLAATIIALAVLSMPFAVWAGGKGGGGGSFSNRAPFGKGGGGNVAPPAKAAPLPSEGNPGKGGGAPDSSHPRKGEATPTDGEKAVKGEPQNDEPSSARATTEED